MVGETSMAKQNQDAFNLYKSQRDSDDEIRKELSDTDRTRARYNLALSFCIYNKYLICACKVIYLLYCMGVKFYITLHCLIIS